MASLTGWTWVSANSGSWWWTGRPGVLRFMGSQRVGHDWATELIWSDLTHSQMLISVSFIFSWMLSILLVFHTVIFTKIIISPTYNGLNYLWSVDLSSPSSIYQILETYVLRRAPLVAQLVKNPPAIQETWVWSLGWEDPLEKGKATHSSVLAWRSPRTVWDHKESDTTDFHFHSLYVLRKHFS